MLHLTISIIIGVNPPAWEAPVGMDWFIGDCNPVSIAIGYGDWATNTEGPHPGLDLPLMMSISTLHWHQMDVSLGNGPR